MFSKTIAMRSVAQSLRLSRNFHLSAPSFIKAGDAIPSTTVFEKSPGNKLTLAEEVAEGKNVIIGVPGAFSPGCSGSHVPGYISQIADFANKGYKNVFVVSVNDAFVMNAWNESFNGPENIRFIADPKGEFTAAVDLLFDASPFFGNERSKRYALLVEDGKVVKEFVEPDNTSVDVSKASSVLEEA